MITTQTGTLLFPNMRNRYIQVGYDPIYFIQNETLWEADETYSRVNGKQTLNSHEIASQRYR